MELEVKAVVDVKTELKVEVEVEEDNGVWTVDEVGNAVDRLNTGVGDEVDEVDGIDMVSA